MTYDQKSGELRDDNGKLIGIGYAGHGLGKNNPEMEDVKNVGPLPKGAYIILSPHDSGNTGPFTMSLMPDPSNKMYGRGGFAIHGDSIKEPGTASNGCIIMPRRVREQIWKSNDKYLEVI